MTIKSARVLDITGGFNFRELGGYSTVNGATVAWHRLLRTAHLSDLTANDWRDLQAYGVGQIIDLRSRAERRQFPDMPQPGVTMHVIPVFDNDETESSTAAAQTHREFSVNPNGGYRRMLYVYRRLIINPGAQRAYRRVFETLLTTPKNVATIFHCSAGKDRTGIGAVFILSALGVPRKQIFADYLLTNSASTQHIEARVKDAKNRYRTVAFQQSIRDLASVNIDYLQQALMLVDYQYGGMQAYLQEVLGMTPQRQQAFRQLYLMRRCD